MDCNLFYFNTNFHIFNNSEKFSRPCHGSSEVTCKNHRHKKICPSYKLITRVLVTKFNFSKYGENWLRVTLWIYHKRNFSKWVACVRSIGVFTELPFISYGDSINEWKKEITRVTCLGENWDPFQKIFQSLVLKYWHQNKRKGHIHTHTHYIDI